MERLHKVEAKFVQADAGIEKAKRFLLQFQTFIEEYKKKETILEALSDFYHSGTWADESDLLRRELPSRYFAAAGEDTILHLEGEFRILNIKMMKVISDYLSKGIEV